MNRERLGAFIFSFQWLAWGIKYYRASFKKGRGISISYRVFIFISRDKIWKSEFKNFHRRSKLNLYIYFVELKSDSQAPFIILELNTVVYIERWFRQWPPTTEIFWKTSARTPLERACLTRLWGSPTRSIIYIQSHVIMFAVKQRKFHMMIIHPHLFKGSKGAEFFHQGIPRNPGRGCEGDFL